jgi:hypothetical protein
MGGPLLVTAARRVAAIKETIRLMSEIDKAIPKRPME